MESSQQPSWRRGGFIDVWSGGSQEPDNHLPSWSSRNLNANNPNVSLAEKPIHLLESGRKTNGDTFSIPNPRQAEFSMGKFLRQFDSSDNSDVMDDGEESEGNKRKLPTSKNLMSERKRRKKLNERLYSLRAVVPNISKPQCCITGNREIPRDAQTKPVPWAVYTESEVGSKLYEDRGGLYEESSKNHCGGVYCQVICDPVREKKSRVPPQCCLKCPKKP